MTNKPVIEELDGDRVRINAEYAQMLLDKIEAERNKNEVESNSIKARTFKMDNRGMR